MENGNDCVKVEGEGGSLRIILRRLKWFGGFLRVMTAQVMDLALEYVDWLMNRDILERNP
jgi:hypothetical protein